MRDFSSAFLKIERAYLRMGEFERERRRFLDANPCKVRPEYDPQADHTNYIVEHVEPIPASISLIVGDAVHNLRSALDHVAASLVRANNKIPKDTIFPICASEAIFRVQGSRRIEEMSPADQARMGLIKPYLGGRDALWGLHRLDITDKHDLLLAQIQCLEAITQRFDEAAKKAFPLLPDEVSIGVGAPLPVPKRDEVLVIFQGSPEKNPNVKLAFDIAFDEVQVFKGRRVGESLLQMAKEVKWVYNAFCET
jgi:hypothetical protein